MSIGSASWRALGTTARVVVASPAPDALTAARGAVEAELAAIDIACSRFREDAELVGLNAAAGSPTRVSPLLLEALEVALRAAELTDGAVDPTIGAALEHAGYDRDFASIPIDGPVPTPLAAPGWRVVRVDRSRATVELPRGVRLDLGATAKALAADRAAASACAAAGAGVLVSLGGDVAIVGPAPAGGWAVGLADDHASATAGPTVGLTGGGLATSSTTVRRWRRGGHDVHHILDPATGAPCPVVWRTASVAAGNCVDANTASTASIVLGARARPWLEAHALPARLVAADGRVVCVGGWREAVA